MFNINYMQSAYLIHIISYNPHCFAQFSKVNIALSTRIIFQTSFVLRKLDILATAIFHLKITIQQIEFNIIRDTGRSPLECLTDQLLGLTARCSYNSSQHNTSFVLNF